MWCALGVKGGNLSKSDFTKRILKKIILCRLLLSICSTYNIHSVASFDCRYIRLETQNFSSNQLKSDSQLVIM